ncbi:NAD-dependent epimerase [Aliarcobacter butzleri]|uniref:NAD-dependent epimerase n=1 Tax=Aliarcobacter butzleri TaxID=28197 RepID=A0AAW6VQZ4_9BACT|nr:NAD-dependent epimerase [Aliarcobacter butzleri]MDK2062875.1 NAD-dependent epimerase [Aliarcobacter butzleri]
MKILVTGTAGFIGYHLAKKLLERGDEVVGLDNINDYYDVNLKYARLEQLGIKRDEVESDNSTFKIHNSKLFPRHKFIKANLEDSQTINNLFETEKFDAVCNLAAQAGVRYSIENPHAYIQSNVVGFMNILEACRNYGVKNLSYASSSSVYGLNKSQPFKTSDHTDHPISLYAATKKSNEMMAHTYSHLYGILASSLRFFTVFGEWGRPDMAPMLFADAITNDRPIKVFNHGNMSRDFTYVGDIVDGIIKVIDNPATPIDNSQFSILNSQFKNLPPQVSTAPYRIYNIGSNSPVQLLDFIKTLEKAIGKEATKNFMDMQDGDVVSTYADVSDLINDFGYKPDTSLEVGIERFVKWYKEFYGEKK